MSNETAATIVAAWMDRVWRQQDESALDDLLTENSVAHGVGDAPVLGREGWHESYRMFTGAFTDFDLEVKEQVVSGDHVASRVVGTLVHRASGKRVPLEIMIMGRVVDGRFEEAWNVVNWVPALMELGLTGADAIERMMTPS
jgi:predicted ester cyclase